MEFEQIVKRLDWLEKQQRGSKDSISTLQERLTSFETTVNAVSKQIKTLDKQVTEVLPATKRIEQFESMLTKLRSDVSKMIDENEKNRARGEREAAKKIQSEFNAINKSAAQLKASLNIQEVKKQIKDSSSEIQRVINNMSDLKALVENAVHSNEDTQHSVLAAEETRKNDLKRVTDMQGELTSLRKRVEEGREKRIIHEDGLRRMEGRFTELLASEQERRQAQAVFLEQQSIAQIDRDNAWKDWREKYDAFQKEAAGLDSHVQKLDEALRGAKKAQETYLELNTKLERRINEVTEMQRLTEDRLRQEWVSFKADDQKRWTGYGLSAEESIRDIRKDVEKAEAKLNLLGETSQVLQDQLHQTTDTTEKQLQETMNVIHEWAASYQRIMGHGKKTTKK